jgi:predicted alpha/beta-hydrolase family hydrolase
MTRTITVKISLGADHAVSGLLSAPDGPTACYVMAHGAGAGMEHPFMAAVAYGLAERGIATLRYQFPYMEHGSRRPDRPEVAHAAVRAAVRSAAETMPGVPLVAGGKSFGGRMISQAQSGEPLRGVRGLVFFGFPLHAAGKPSADRAEHLFEVRVPMLFLQGTRDALAALSILVLVVDRLRELATLSIVENADHSFHVPAKSGKTDGQVMGEMLDVMAGWIAGSVR